MDETRLDQQENPAFSQQPLGPTVDHLAALERVAGAVDFDVDFPAYCYQDAIFSDPAYPVAIRCEDEETHDPFHVVLISSFDGNSWWCWIVETRKFEIMEFQWED